VLIDSRQPTVDSFPMPSKPNEPRHAIETGERHFVRHDKPTTQIGLANCRDFPEIFILNFTKWAIVKSVETIVSTTYIYDGY
jgi:hypothetical protein